MHSSPGLRMQKSIKYYILAMLSWNVFAITLSITSSLCPFHSFMICLDSKSLVLIFQSFGLHKVAKLFFSYKNCYFSSFVRVSNIYSFLFYVVTELWKMYGIVYFYLIFKYSNFDLTLAYFPRLVSQHIILQYTQSSALPPLQSIMYYCPWKFDQIQWIKE